MHTLERNVPTEWQAPTLDPVTYKRTSKARPRASRPSQALSTQTGLPEWPPDPAFTAHASKDLLAELPDGKTRYRLEGDTGPLIIYLHGNHFNKDEFDVVAPLLVGHDFRLLRYDQWGHGYSKFPEGKEPTWELFCTQLVDLTKYLGIKEPFHLVGFSMGGALAPQFAMRFPEKVNKVVLIGPTTLAHLRKPMSDAMTSLFAKKMSQSIPSLYFADPSSADAVKARRFLDLQAHGANSEGVKIILKAVFNSALSQDQEALETLGANHEVLVLWGKKDTVCDYRAIRNFQELIPRAVFVGITGAAHADVLAAHSGADTAHEIGAFLCNATQAYRSNLEARKSEKLELRKS